MKNILVTGFSGFLGRHLCKHLSSLNWKIYLSNTTRNNLNDINNLSVFDHIKFDYIFHLAAHTKAGDYCLYHRGEQFITNQIINTNILKYWKNSQPQAKMIAMGTSCSYDPTYEMEEANYLKGQPFDDLYVYAMTKRMLLIGLQAYAEQYNMKYMYYIPSTLYGPDFDLHDSHFIFDLIKKIYKGKYSNEEVILWGTGDQKRELIYIDDAISLMLNTLDRENECLNLSSGTDFTIKEFAKNICQIYDYDFTKIIYDTSKYMGVLKKNLSTKKIKQFAPCFEFTDLEKGLKETILYYNAQVSSNIL